MTRKLDLKVGQKVAIKIEERSNAARRVNMSLDNIDKWCFDGEIIKIGRKYIGVKLNEYWTEEFSIENDYKQKYTSGTADYKLYLTREEVIEECEANDLYYTIKRKCFSDYDNKKLNLDQLKRIKEIIDKNIE